MNYESVFGKQQCCKCGTWHTIGTQIGLNHTLYAVDEATGEETAYTDWYCGDCAMEYWADFDEYYDPFD